MGIFSFILGIFGKRPEPEKERGTVVYQSPEHKVCEVGGITLTSSVFIKKFTEEETRENAKDNRWFYEPAYKQVIQTIEADQRQIDAMFDELLVAFTAGDPRREQKVVEQFLPEGTWRWPAYEVFTLPRDEEYYQECLEVLQSATLFDLLMMLKAQPLRVLFKEFAGNKAKSPGRKKHEIATALIELLPPEKNVELAERLRTEEIAAMESPGTPDYKEMVSLLFRRIATIAYGIRRKAQLCEMADRYPMWEFAVVTHYDTPAECIKRNGKRFRHDDPIWDEFPPCSNLKCGCRIRPVMDKNQAVGNPMPDEPPVPADMGRHVGLINAALETFDGTSDIDIKADQLPIIERELAEILRLEPESSAAHQLQAMLPGIKTKLYHQAAGKIIEEKIAEERAVMQRSEPSDPSIDEMRQGLQKVAYGMVGKGVSSDEKARFKQDMTEFASADPLVREIAERVRDLVAETPGLLQSKIYGNFPEYDKEQVRYALYFANELGLVHRKKKGNSYELFPPGSVIDME